MGIYAPNPAQITTVLEKCSPLSVIRWMIPSSSRSNPTTFSPRQSVVRILKRLLLELPGQILGHDLGKTGDVKDVLLGIERHQSAADLFEHIDRLEFGHAETGIVHAIQRDRSGADKRDVVQVGASVASRAGYWSYENSVTPRAWRECPRDAGLCLEAVGTEVEVGSDHVRDRPSIGQVARSP